MLEDVSNSGRALLTTTLIEMRRQGIALPEIASVQIEEVANLRPLGIRARADRLLRFFCENSEVLGAPIAFPFGEAMWMEMLAVSESIDDQDLGFLRGVLKDDGLVREEAWMGGAEVTVLIGGWERVDQLAQQRAELEQGFVAMWFDESMNAVFDSAIARGISDAGYKAMRIDRKDHNNKIDDEIIAEIRRSRFLVADFTHGADGARGGVYYEAGFAHGLGIPVIFTVREDQISKAHFDTRQYAHIVWKDAADLRAKLSNRISATLGDGPNKKPA